MILSRKTISILSLFPCENLRLWWLKMELIWSLVTLWYFQGAESASFRLYSKYEEKVPVNFFIKIATLLNRLQCWCFSEYVHFQGLKIKHLSILFIRIIFTPSHLFVSLMSHDSFFIAVVIPYLEWQSCIGWNLNIRKRRLDSNEKTLKRPSYKNSSLSMRHQYSPYYTETSRRLPHQTTH